MPANAEAAEPAPQAAAAASAPASSPIDWEVSLRSTARRHVAGIGQPANAQVVQTARAGEAPPADALAPGVRRARVPDCIAGGNGEQAGVPGLGLLNAPLVAVMALAGKCR